MEIGEIIETLDNNKIKWFNGFKIIVSSQDYRYHYLQEKGILKYKLTKNKQVNLKRDGE